jgi:hypothetical protein
MERITSLVVEPHPEKIPALDLTHIVYDELVVQQRTTSASWRALPARHQNITEHSTLLGGSPTASLRRMLALRQQIRVIISIELLIDLAQGHLAKQHQSRAVLF